jgi:SH3-like domain-containing protein
MNKVAGAMLAAVAVAGGVSAASGPRKPPYWASISAGEARMRTGPGRQFPANWYYQRAGLPVRVLETYPGWRKVRDPDGAEGWMIANLISDQRTVMVRGGVAALRDSPNVAGHVAWRAEPGVIGRVSACEGGWCKLDVKGRAGYVETSHLWGVDPDEKLD